MVEDGAEEFIEVGPGRVLQGLVKKINGNINSSSLNLENVYIYAKPTPENRANDFSYMKEHCSNKWTYIN